MRHIGRKPYEMNFLRLVCPHLCTHAALAHTSMSAHLCPVQPAGKVEIFRCAFTLVFQRHLTVKNRKKQKLHAKRRKACTLCLDELAHNGPRLKYEGMRSCNYRYTCASVKLMRNTTSSGMRPLPTTISVYLVVHLSDCVRVRFIFKSTPSIYAPQSYIHGFTSVSIDQPMHSSICVSMHLNIGPSVGLSIQLPMYIIIDLCIYLSVNLTHQSVQSIDEPTYYTIYILIHVYMHSCICTRTCTCTYTLTHACIHGSAHGYIQVGVSKYIPTSRQNVAWCSIRPKRSIHKFVHIFVRTSMRACIHGRMHA